MTHNHPIGGGGARGGDGGRDGETVTENACPLALSPHCAVWWRLVRWLPGDAVGPHGRLEAGHPTATNQLRRAHVFDL